MWQIKENPINNPSGSEPIFSLMKVFPFLRIAATAEASSCLSSAAFLCDVPVYTFCPSRQVITRKLNQNRGVYFPTFLAKSDFAGNLRSSKIKEEQKIRIGIVGGGIAGVSVAHSLAQKVKGENNIEITVLEGEGNNVDPNEYSGMTLPLYDINHISPVWIAATARNANSMVPAAAMHVFSRKEVVWDVICDTVEEWFQLQLEKFHKITKDKYNHVKISPELRLDRIDDFSHAPPYFALHLFKCLGWHVNSDERWSFVNFLKHFMYAALWLGDEAADSRGRCLCQLAKATRTAYLKALEDDGAQHSRGGKILSSGQKEEATESLRERIGHSKGFISLYRSEKSAKQTYEEIVEHGEEAALLSMEEVIREVPQLANLPIQRMYGVKRFNDHTASCETFFHHWIEECQRMGVNYKVAGQVDSLVTIKSNGENSKGKCSFKVATKNGFTEEFDILVLAAGAQTPLMAAQLGVAKYCPTYPLRGYSLTIFNPKEETEENASDSQRSKNLLQQPFSVDSIYCSSVGPFTARLAGFGEFVGYRRNEVEVPSLAPRVLSRYAQTVFPGAVNTGIKDVSSCFRPLSPDDLPLAGEVPTHPGLFIHTGHGTLGWTTGLATGECVAQAIVDRLDGVDTQKGKFILPDDSQIDRALLSPKRFVK